MNALGFFGDAVIGILEVTHRPRIEHRFQIFELGAGTHDIIMPNAKHLQKGGPYFEFLLKGAAGTKAALKTFSGATLAYADPDGGVHSNGEVDPNDGSWEEDHARFSIDLLSNGTQDGVWAVYPALKDLS